MEKQDNEIRTEELHKELDLVQSCILRMAQNSFMIKGWAFALVTAFVALTAEKLELYVLCAVGIFILFAFWYLDAFFLKMEKLYRFKYEWIITERAKGNRKYLYDLNPYQNETRLPKKKTPTVVSVMFSSPRTLLLFYGSPIWVGIIAMILRAVCII